MRDRGPGPPVTPETELALLLCGTRARREAARDRIAELAAGRIDAVLEHLRYQRVLLLGATRLQEIVPAAFSIELRSSLQQALRDARLRAALFAVMTERLTDALEAAGIHSVPLKGAALAAQLYGDEAMREYVDIDMLVAAAELDEAVSVAYALGWTEEPTRPPEGHLPELHRALVHPTGALPELELHWRVHWYEGDFGHELLERSRIIGSTRMPDPTDQLAALLLFYARDGFAGLRLAADIAAWWDRHATAGTLPALGRLAERHPALARVWATALAAVTPVAGLPIAACGGDLRPQGRRAALARRLANWDLRGDPDQIMANVALIDGLLAPRPELSRFLRRQALRRDADLGTPPRGATAFSALATHRRLAHISKSIARYAMALGHLRRGRSWSPVPPSAFVAAR